MKADPDVHRHETGHERINISLTTLFDALVGWALFGALTLELGVLAGRWLVLPMACEAWGESRRQLQQVRLARMGLWGGLLLAVSVGLYFIRQVRDFRDPFVPWLHDALFLLQRTEWGRLWLLAAIGSVAVFLAFRWASRGRAVGWWLATPLVLALAAFPGFTGHAAGEDPLRALALAADALHVWAAGGWVGGLGVVLYLAGSGRPDPHGAPPVVLGDLIPPFSRVAMVSVAILVLSGGFASWLHLTHLSDLWTTSYGRLLGTKVGLAGVVIAIGGVNARILTPRLGTSSGDGALRRAATVEFALAQLVLIVTALLVRTSP